MSKLSPNSDFKLSPRPTSNSTETVYAGGTAYQLTQTPALLNLGTTPASIVLNSPGTYLLLSRARLDYNAATFAAVRTVSLKLRRINNTAADVTGATSSLLTQIITLLTFTAGYVVLPPVIYTTLNSNDNIQVFGSVDTLPTAGTFDVSEAEIVAIKLS